jgi:hypothetical protein
MPPNKQHPQYNQTNGSTELQPVWHDRLMALQYRGSGGFPKRF